MRQARIRYVRQRYPRAWPPRAMTVLLREIASGITSAHVINPGDTVTVTVSGYITLEGKTRAVIEFPVEIRVF